MLPKEGLKMGKLLQFSGFLLVLMALALFPRLLFPQGLRCSPP